MKAVELLTLAFLVHATAGLSVAGRAPLPSAPQLHPNTLTPDMIPARGRVRPNPVSQLLRKRKRKSSNSSTDQTRKLLYFL